MSDPFAKIRDVKPRKLYGICAGCGAKTPEEGAGVVRLQVIERKKDVADKAVVNRSATTCPACAIKLWEKVNVAFDEVGI